MTGIFLTILAILTINWLDALRNQQKLHFGVCHTNLEPKPCEGLLLLKIAVLYPSNLEWSVHCFVDLNVSEFCGQSNDIETLFPNLSPSGPATLEFQNWSCSESELQMEFEWSLQLSCLFTVQRLYCSLVFLFIVLHCVFEGKPPFSGIFFIRIWLTGRPQESS